MEEEEEERDLIKDLKRHGRLAVAWDRHGSPVTRWTFGLCAMGAPGAPHPHPHPPQGRRRRL